MERDEFEVSGDETEKKLLWKIFVFCIRKIYQNQTESHGF